MVDTHATRGYHFTHLSYSLHASSTMRYLVGRFRQERPRDQEPWILEKANSGGNDDLRSKAEFCRFDSKDMFDEHQVFTVYFWVTAKEAPPFLVPLLVVCC